MSSEFRALPDRPSLRYLKLEAKRRLSAGEFAALHEAQLAIAREHSFPSWAALKQAISDQARLPSQSSHALAQLKWIVNRFANAGGRAWVAPAEDELREHFSDRFLTRIPPDELVEGIASLTADLRHEFRVTRASPLAALVEIAGIETYATVEADPPHRLVALRRYPLAGRVTDPRTATPQMSTLGEVPAEVAEMVEQAFAELGLAGVILAGGNPDTPAWVVAVGWANLERAEAMRIDHRFPAYGITQPITAAAVLRLVAQGHIRLEDPANTHLRTIRLSDDTVTVRELLAHTGGVDHFAEPLAESVPELVSLVGPLIACNGKHGTFHNSNEGYATLGQLIADVTRSPYTAAAARLVLDPLGMRGSTFPRRWPRPEPDAITGYKVTPEGAFGPIPDRIYTMPAAGGLWATATDLVRFALGWQSLLPSTLAREAITPQTIAAGPSAGQRGLGWTINPQTGTAAMTGDGPGANTSLQIDLGSNYAQVALTNRAARIDPLNARILRACTTA